MTPHRNHEVTQTAARHGALGLIGGLVAGFGGLLLTIIVSRLMAKEQAGIYFTIVALFMIATTVTLGGSDTGLVRGLAALRAIDQAGALRMMIRTAMTPVLWITTILALVIFVAAAPLARVMVDAAHQAEMASALRAAAPFLVIASLTTLLLNGISRGMGSMRTFTTVQQLFLPLSRPLLVVAALVIAGTRHSNAAVIAIVAWAVPLVIAAVWAAREVNRLLPPPDTAPATSTIAVEHVRRFWRRTIPRGVAAIFEIIIVWADVIIVTAFLGAAQGAIYAAASRFVTSGTFALQAVRLSISPLLAGAFARSDHEQAGYVHRLSVRWCILSTWPVYLALAIFAPGVLAILGPAFGSAALALVILSMGMLAVVATGNANTVLNMSHHSHWAAGNTALATAIMLTVDFLLVPRFGILGAAIGWVSAMVTDAMLGVIEIHRGLRLRSFDAGIVRVMLVTILCFGLPALAFRVLGERWAWPAPAVLVVGGSLAGMSYAAAVWWQRAPLAVDGLWAALRKRPVRDADGHRLQPATGDATATAGTDPSRPESVTRGSDDTSTETTVRPLFAATHPQSLTAESNDTSWPHVLPNQKHQQPDPARTVGGQ